MAKAIAMLRGSDDLGPSPFRRTLRLKSSVRPTRRHKSSILTSTVTFNGVKKGRHAIKSASPLVVTEFNQILAAGLGSASNQNLNGGKSTSISNLEKKIVVAKQDEPERKLSPREEDDLDPVTLKSLRRLALTQRDEAPVDAAESIQDTRPSKSAEQEHCVTSDKFITVSESTTESDIPGDISTSGEVLDTSLDTQQHTPERVDRPENLSTPQPFLLTGLGRIPPEIRVMIWEYVLTPSTKVRLTTPSTSAQDLMTCPAILQTCRLVFSEAQKVFYSAQSFRFVDTPSFLGFLKTIEPCVRKELRHLHISELADRQPIYTEKVLNTLCDKMEYNDVQRQECARRTRAGLHSDANETAHLLRMCDNLQKITINVKLGEEIIAISFLKQLYEHGNIAIDFEDDSHWAVKAVEYLESEAWEESGCWIAARLSLLWCRKNSRANDRLVEVTLVDKRKNLLSINTMVNLVAFEAVIPSKLFPGMSKWRGRLVRDDEIGRNSV